MVAVEDGNFKCYILEINSAPSLTSPYRQECMAKGFDWIVEHGKDHIPLVEERGGYRKFIHPAVCDKAVLVGPRPKKFDEVYMKQFNEEDE